MGFCAPPEGLTHRIPCSRAEELGEKVGGLAKEEAPYLGLEHSSLRQGKVWMVRRRSLFSRRMRSCSKLRISSTCFCSSSTWFCSPSIVSVKLWREEGARMKSQALQVLERRFFPIEKASLWKMLPVSSPGSVTAFAFHGSSWSCSVWLLLSDGGACRTGWGIEAVGRDCTNLRPSLLRSVG